MVLSSKNQSRQNPLNQGYVPKGGKRRKPTQQIMEDMAEGMILQNEALLGTIKSVQNDMKGISKYSRTDRVISEQIHDRLETLIIEQKTTNLLLSELVAIHSSIIPKDEKREVQSHAENVRLNAYDRVLRGQ